MNSLSRGTLLPRVTSFLSTPKSATLRNARPTICSSDNEIYEGYFNSVRNIRTENVRCVSAAQQHTDTKDGFVKKMFQKYNLFNMSDAKLRQSGYYLYESIADKIDYAEFFIEFNMNDNFFSWFLITELHVWMLMVRTMAEKEDGKMVRNSMVEAMWGDTTTRAKVLWSENPGGVRKNVQELADQFNCAIIGYDEGINGDDKVLAGAIWRRIFQLECNNPEDVEKILIYIRKQMNNLDKLPKDDIIWNPNIKWLPLNDL